MESWSTEFRREILAADSFRQAISLFFRNGERDDGAQAKPMSYSSLSRRLGLRSRSHVREIVEGLKPVPKSFPLAFCRAMKINAPWTRYFELLSKEPPRESANRPRWELERDLLRQKLHKRLERREIHGPSSTAGCVLREPEFPLVFAALGDAIMGASMYEIALRTKLPPGKISGCLDALVSSGVVAEENDRYIARNPHLIFSGIGEEEYFRLDLHRSLERAKQKIRAKPTGAEDTALFFNSTLCVRAADLPQLKESLKQLLTQYVDSAENSTGDQVVSLVTCLTPAHEQ